MEFLVQSSVEIPEGADRSEVEERRSNEAAAAARLAKEGSLVRLWKAPAGASGSGALGLYRVESRDELDRLLGALPLADWMRVTVTPLEPHRSDPASRRPSRFRLPAPRLTPVYHLEATVGEPLELGDTPAGHRRIVPLTGGTFTGPRISGTLVPGASADWQTVLEDGTALGDIRYALRTDGGDLVTVEARGVRHGSPEVLARLARGEDVDAGEYTFRTSIRMQTASPALDWLNKGVFVAVGGRRPGAVVYETYLVG